MDQELELLTTEIKKVALPQLSNNGKSYSSRIIREQDLAPHVEDGWEIIRELSSGNLFVRKPNHTQPSRSSQDL